MKNTSGIKIKFLLYNTLYNTFDHFFLIKYSFIKKQQNLKNVISNSISWLNYGKYLLPVLQYLLYPRLLFILQCNFICFRIQLHTIRKKERKEIVKNNFYIQIKCTQICKLRRRILRYHMLRYVLV